jgi:hypothetical protein
MCVVFRIEGVVGMVVVWVIEVTVVVDVHC